jgi:lysophospholipase L1-like esterase
VSRSIDSYVALGDSFTSGTDPHEPRWADEVARALGVSVRYANLAEVGATSRHVEERQLEAALCLRPDLISLICGANDVLESVRPEPEGFRDRLSRMLDKIGREAPEATVVTATYPDLSRFLELRERTRERVRRGVSGFNEVVREVAGERGALLLEWSEHPGTVERGNFAPDGFHPSRNGHLRAAAEIVAALEKELAVGSSQLAEARDESSASCQLTAASPKEVSA